MAEETLEKQLKESQKRILKPGKKFLNALAHYLNFLNPLGTTAHDHKTEEGKSTFKSQKHNDITWIDIENPKRKDIQQLSDDYSFHPLHLEACLAKGQLDRVEKEEKYLFILLHSPSYHADTDKITTNKIYIFLGKNYLITIHPDSAHVVSDMFKKTESDKEQQEQFFKKSSGFLLYNILDTLIKDTATLRKTILQELDEIDDVVFDTKVSGIYEISMLRQRIVRLRRVIGALRKILLELVGTQSDFTSGMTRYYKSISNEADKLWDTLEEAKETIEIYKDADFTVSTEKTNKILTVLTVIFTFTIPTTIVGTLYGMNILLPGGIEAGSWLFLGPFTTFYLIVSASVLSILSMLLYFKYKEWF